MKARVPKKIVWWILFRIPNRNYRSLMQARSEIQTNIGRISPSNLYNEAASSILGLRASAFFVVGGMQQQIRPSLAQGIAASWPQVLAIFVGMLACFVISYLRFLRLEIRPGG
jgi:ABC-type transport system involved in multi-copper enzyme maturation permease subunit